MTACTNHGGKARRVVTAALVGVLSVGTVPMAALATGVSDGIQQLAADWTTDAKIAEAEDGLGNTLSGDFVNMTFAQGSGKYLVPTRIESKFLDETGFDVSLNDLTYYHADAGNTSMVSRNNWDQITNNPGVYRVAVKHNSASVDFYFKIVADTQAFEGAYAYVGDDPTVKEIVVDGSTWGELKADIKFADADGYQIDGVKVGDFKRIDGSVITSADDAYMVSAGEYYVTVDKGASHANIRINVQKLDLSQAALTIDDVTSLASNEDLIAKLKLNGVDVKEKLEQKLEVTKVINPDGGASLGAKGLYEITVAPTSNNDSVTGVATVRFANVKNDYADIAKYGRQSASEGGKIDIWLEDGQTFDASELSVSDTTGQHVFSGDQIEVTYSKGGKTVEPSALASAGIYAVTARIVPGTDFKSGDWYGGSINFTVTVHGTEVASSSDIAFFLNGELSGNDGSVYYDGTDALGKLRIVVKKGDKTFVEGTDYTVEVTKDKKPVDEAVNAGVYEVTVKPITFQFDGNEDQTEVFTLTVNKAKIGTPSKELKNYLYSLTPYVNDAVAYTGSAVEIPGVQYPVLEADGTTVAEDEDGNVIYAELDPSMYNIVSIHDGSKYVNEAVEAGKTYTVRIALTDEASENYQLEDKDFTFEVKKYSPFADVESPAWYAQVLDTAMHNGYVNGKSGTKLYMPEADITRADAVCVLYNMAGGKKVENMTWKEKEAWTSKVSFTDVDVNEYYGVAIGWADSLGIANGFNGEFRPTDTITREEFAALLSNYAKATGDYEAVDADAVLGSATDYSAWAKDVVAWAKANGVMGNGGYIDGTGNVTRAEVAAMAVNYQPEKL